MKKIVFLLEERSAEELLNTIIPKIIPSGDFSFLCIPHEGKSHLRKSIPIKLRAWKEPYVQFVVLHDKDASDCFVLQKDIISLAEKSNRADTLVRIACTELESWFLGDLDAVEKAFSVDLTKKKNKSIYQNPDSIVNAKQELKHLIPQYQPILGSRKISEYMNIKNNKSKSFQVFVSGLHRLCKA
jgi:uncharacterized protein YktA (UPF0223 family)